MSQVHPGPFQTQELAAAHAGVKGQDDEIGQIRGATLAAGGGEQPAGLTLAQPAQPMRRLGWDPAGGDFGYLPTQLTFTMPDGGAQYAELALERAHADATRGLVVCQLLRGDVCYGSTRETLGERTHGPGRAVRGPALQIGQRHLVEGPGRDAGGFLLGARPDFRL